MGSPCSTHLSSGRTAVTKRFRSDDVVVLQTAQGSTQLDKEIEVVFPSVKESHIALYNPSGPDMAAWGQFVLEDGWVVDHCSAERGLIMRDSDGYHVDTCMEDCVPCLARSPSSSIAA